tara:strand:+ start:1490 stop:1642 length:153 start_codon:yes stop_codon:yes gene_type:complete
MKASEEVKDVQPALTDEVTEYKVTAMMEDGDGSWILFAEPEDTVVEEKAA